MISEGRYERAEVLYRQLLTVAPRDHALWLKHAELLKRLERTEPAVSSYRMAAQLLMDFGYANRAIAALKIALELRPDDIELVSDIIRYELRQRQRSREMPAVVAAENSNPVAPAELHALADAETTSAPKLLALPMLSTSESRLSAMVHDVLDGSPAPRPSVPRIPVEVETPLQTWPQVRRISETELAIKPSPFAHWIVVTSHTSMEVRFFDEYVVPEEAHWLEEPSS